MPAEKWRSSAAQKPATCLVAAVLFVVAALHVLRLILSVEVSIDGTAIPYWPSGIAVVFTLLLGAAVLREVRR